MRGTCVKLPLRTRPSSLANRKGLIMSIDIKWLLPIGGRDFTMNLTEAVQAAIMIKPNDMVLKKAKDL